MTVVEPEAYARRAVASKRNVDTIVSFGFVMRTLRAAGVDFATAWEIAFPKSDSSRDSAPLRTALAETRDSWERAYLGEPPERGEAAVSILAPFLLDEPHATAGELTSASLVA